jgi:hypothetical protein
VWKQNQNHRLPSPFRLLSSINEADQQRFNMLLFGHYCNYRIIRNFFILIAALFTGYLMGVNTAANSCFRVASNSLLDCPYCSDCSKQRNEIEKSDEKFNCARKLSAAIASLGVNKPGNNSLSDLLSDEEKHMQKMIETIVNKYQGGNSAVNAVRLSSHEFLNTFDYGYPTDNTAQTKEMLMLYNSKDLVPNVDKEADGGDENTELIPFIGNLSTATAKCRHIAGSLPCYKYGHWERKLSRSTLVSTPLGGFWWKVYKYISASK